MSNIKKQEKDKKSKSVSLRLTEGQKKIIEKGAKKEQISMSDYIVKKATENGRTKKCMENERIYRLVKTEEALGKLILLIDKMNPDRNIVEATNSLKEEIRELWHF